MKLHGKVSCAQCAQYRLCPLKTRILINYCGSKSRDLEKKLKAAMADCRLRKGHMFKRNLLIHTIKTKNTHLLTA